MKPLLRFLKGVLKLVLVAGLGVGGWYGYQTYVVEETEDSSLDELPTVVAEVRDITVAVAATGVLQPVRIIEVKSKASGEILDMPVELGDFLNAGDLVAQVDTEILEQELKQAEADHNSAKTRLRIAESQYQRAQELQTQDLISDNDLENSEQSFITAEASLLRAEADLALVRERLDDATVRAPITGTVIGKTVEEGTIIQSSTSNVSGGTTLVSMADLSQLEIRTLVDEIDIGQVEPGLAVNSTVEAFPDRAFEGAVVKIEPNAVVQQSVTTFPVLSRIDNSDGLLLPGMNADVQIIVHRRPRVLAVPNEAVRTPDDAEELVRMLGLSQGPGGDPMTSRPVDGPSGDAMVASMADDDNGDNGSPPGPDDPGYVPSEEELRQLMAEMRERGGDSGRRGGFGRGGDDGDDDDRGSSASRGASARGGNGAGGGRAGGAFDLSDPEVRRRTWEGLQRRLRESAAGDDPWGVESGRREPAVVFMADGMGNIVPREIVAGVRDWEYTEVVNGLDAGDELVILPSVSLLESQESLRERFSRRGGGIPGLGGPGGRR